MRATGATQGTDGIILCGFAFRRAFTLIELLVVIAIIGILASLILPVMARAKSRAQGIQCLSNLRQLQLAWHLYSSDNQGKLPVNSDGSDAGQSIDEASWVAGWLTTGSSPDNTNTELLVGKEYQRFGSVGGYVENAGIYHCPADTSVDSGKGLPRVRSVSMNGWMNPGLNGPYSGNSETLAFEKYRRESDFIHLAPTDAFVFLDERPDSINDGCFRVETAS